MAEQIVSTQDAVQFAAEDEVTGFAEMQQDPDKGPSTETHLNPRQVRLLAALVSNSDIQLACKTAEVSRTAAYSWLKQPAFQKELSRQRDAVLSEALASVKTLAARAVADQSSFYSISHMLQFAPHSQRLALRSLLDPVDVRGQV